MAARVDGGCGAGRLYTYIHQPPAPTPDADWHAWRCWLQCVHVQARAYGFQVVNAAQEATQKVSATDSLRSRISSISSRDTGAFH